MYKINASVHKDEKDWTKILDGYEIIFMEVTGITRIEEIPADIDQTMHLCMKQFINPKERKVLYLRYFGNLTYKSIGERLDLNAERIRQIQNKAFRKLRHSTCRKIMYYGMDYYNKMLEVRRVHSEEVISEKIQELEDNIVNAIDHNDYNKLLELKRDIQIYLNSKYGTGVSELYEADMPISTLMLSVRTYNCLRRAGYETVGQLENKTYSDIMKIRNLGRRSLEELLQSCAEHGISIINDYQ